jgi:hypothetical protein
MGDKTIKGLADELSKASDTPKEAPVEAPVEAAVKEAPVQAAPIKEAPKEAPKAEPVKDNFDWSRINKILGRDEQTGFKDEDSFKKFFEETNGKVGKLTEYEQALEARKTQDLEYQAIMEHVKANEGVYDPKNTIFKGDEVAMKKYLLAQALKDRGMNENVINRALDPNFAQMESLDVIAIGRQLESTRLSGKEDAIKKNVLREVVPNFDEFIQEGKSVSEIVQGLTPEQKVELDMEADRYITKVRTTVEGIQIPEVADPIKKILELTRTQRETATQLKAAWESKETTDKLNQKLDTLTLSHEGYEFPYKMSETDKAVLAQSIALAAAVKGVALNEDNVNAMVADAKAQFIGKNAGKLFSAAMKQVELKSNEKIEKEVYNGTPTDIQRVKETKEETNTLDSAFEKQFKRRDVRNR